MKLTTAVLCAGLLALGACEKVRNDPDIQEAGAALKGAVKDRGAALKEVRQAEAERQAEQKR
jgi:hypothetical protein